MAISAQKILLLTLERNTGNDKIGTMKKIALFISISAGLCGCDPGYRIYICNNSSADLYIKTRPTIESLYSGITSSYKDSILICKVGQKGQYGIYRLHRNDTFRIDGSYGFEPEMNKIAFDYISVAGLKDTIEMIGKPAIFSKVRLMSKRKQGGDYCIDISKIKQ